MSRGRVLIVAGSDSGGGAGIQADIKAVTALGGHAATAITALTAQNTTGVYGIHEVPLDFLRQQMELVLEDIGADCIKTGMLHSPEVIHLVADVLEAHAPDVPLVVDPVMVAKGGARLLQEQATQALRTRLLPMASVLTPNLPEAEILAERPISSLDDQRAAGAALRAMGAAAVLMKGGHLEGPEVNDLLLGEGGERLFTAVRLETRHTHGTGCTLASAIACGLALGRELETAVAEARDYVLEAIRTAPGLGRGHGPLNHGHTLHRA